MRSQRIGQGFESPRLHQNPKDTAKSVSFGFLRSRQGSELARDIISSNAFLYLPILAATACTSSVRAGSAACGARRFRPRRRPSGTTGLQIYIPRQTSALMAKLPSSRPAATPQSRCPSDFCVAGRGATARSPNPERNGKHMLKHRLKRDERSARRFGGLRSRTLSPFPTTRDMSDIPPQRTAYSSPHPYGEAPFFSCG